MQLTGLRPSPTSVCLRSGMRVASTAPLASIIEGFVTAVRRFAANHDIPIVDFAKGHRSSAL
ncbi:hypothetical protein FRAHR75_810006 [Frankia sp. Hr75.2]|nr:hypothetical protein FRAHR75_810006 [Frankia sp. Hr75.2]